MQNKNIYRVNRWQILALLGIWIMMLTGSDLLAATIKHDLDIELKPHQSSIVVQDTVVLESNEGSKPGKVSFLLHSNLKVTAAAGIELHKTDILPQFKDLVSKAAVPVSQYTLSVKDNVTSFKIFYEGKIEHLVSKPGEEYARSFSETPGLITKEGVFLARSTMWYPVFGENELVKFDARIQVPVGWGALTQGELIKDSRDQSTRTLHWSESNPQDDIYLVASHYVEYQQTVGSATAMVYMRKKDDALAQKYLDATGQYISMYTTLLGPYPYKKFALVENFWETGYGMPSFTLLGPQVIRFPFIIHSSYPHEILHNYWGNSVFVNYEKGNWAEGLTAYLADHLIQEQRGNGTGYRRNVLQKYADFVNKEKDFALTEFRSRHSSATEAVGYGKTMMLFHMLRLKVGHKNFIRSLRAFYKNFRYAYATFEDIEKTFSEVSEMDLKPFFNQWVSKPGAPQLNLSNVVSNSMNKGYVIDFSLKQIQPGMLYDLDVPVVVYLEGSDEVVHKTVSLKDRKRVYSIELQGKPVRIDVDPEFDLFRRLDSREIPSALSQGFGDEKPLIVLPSVEGNKRLAAYTKLAKQWQASQTQALEITNDKYLQHLPTDRSIWILGEKNKFKNTVLSALASYGVKKQGSEIKLNDKTIHLSKDSVILTTRHPNNIDKSLLWLASTNVAAIPGLARKLPHYRKYSYLAFEGDAPNNILKGQWDVTDSPMRVAINKSSAKAKLPARQPLATLPPAFSVKNMMKDVRYLAHKERKGRGLGTKELDEAADYIADEFKKAGLLPGGGDSKDSYFQTWKMDVGEPLGEISMKNVIAVLPGVNPKLKKESIVISAHYDHLGLGWPDVHKGDEGKVHSGADDNASGVAVMLEFARRIAKKWKPERSIVFIAFTGEEAKRLGSIHYVKTATQYPAKMVFSVINLDTVGRLGDNPITVLGAGTASELVHVFRGTGFVTGIGIKPVMNDFGTSDQTSFMEVGVPGVQLFATAHTDFHRPGDTVDKIDESGLVKVAAVLKEAAEYLANRIEPLNVTLKSNSGSTQAGRSEAQSGRKVRLGTIPDFAYQGNGMKLEGVAPGSPAEKAGLKKGDIIVSMNGKQVKDVAGMAAVLRAAKIGDKISIRYMRGDKTLDTEAIAEQR